MGLGEELSSALARLWANRLRAGLTVLSLAIGAAGIVAMTSLATSGLRTLTVGIEDIGGTRFMMVYTEGSRRGAPRRDRYLKTLTWDDRLALERSVPNLDTISAGRTFHNQSVRVPGTTQSMMTAVVQTEASYLDAYHLPVAHGRRLDEEDRRQHREVAVVGRKLATEFFGSPEAALGREIADLRGRWRIVGVLGEDHKTGNFSLGFDWEKMVVIPLSPAAHVDVGTITMTVKRTEDSAQAVRVINAVLLHRHQGVDNFTIFDFAGMLKGFYQAFTLMQVVVAVVTGIALLIGGVGVMNIMLVAVRERIKEIGLRKALGATEGDIRRMFLLEAVLLSSIGAGVGAACGSLLAVGANAVVRFFQPTWVPSFSFPALGAAVVASALVGVIFGWAPAARAAKLSPIECLRTE